MFGKHQSLINPKFLVSGVFDCILKINKVDGIMGSEFKNITESSIINESTVTTIGEKTSEQPDPWYRKPVGIVVLGVVVTVISLIITNVIKLP